MNISKFLKNKYIAIAAVTLLVAAVIVSAVLLTGSGPVGKADVEAGTAGKMTVAVQEALLKLSRDDISVEPTASDSAGVALDSGFKITSKADIDKSLLETALTVKPAQSYSIKSVSDKEFLVEFDKPLESDSIYRIALGGEEKSKELSWAFQTKKDFRILRSLPRDEGTGVPVNSGIEITFSHEGVESLDGFFEITPKVSGRFEYHKKVAVFVPEALDYNTIYTVKIKKGVGLKDSDEKTKEDYEFQFQTQSQDSKDSKKVYYFNFSDSLYNFTTGEVPNLSVYGDDYFMNGELTVNVYKYRDTEQFMNDLKEYDKLPAWAQKSSGDFSFDTSKLDKAATFNTKVYNMESPWYQQLIVFPDKMPEGHYLVSVTLGEYEFYAHMQVNDLSVYIMQGSSETLAWVNDSKTGNPVPDAAVESEGKGTVKTDSDGIARIADTQENGQASDAGYFLITAGGKPDFIARVSGYPSYYYNYNYGTDTANPAVKYWSYLYLDRGMYLPDDTIRMWGLIQPRDRQESVQKLTLELAKYTYSSNSNEKSVLKSSEIELSQYGTFTGEFKFENFNPGSYYVIARVGDEVLEQVYVQISEYTKPAYKIEASSDKDFCSLGDTVNFNVAASFFEGSPVSGLKLNYSSYPYSSSALKSSEGQLTCGKDGSVSLKYVPETQQGMAVDWHPVNVSFMFENALAEEQDVRTAHSVLVFPRDVMIAAEGRITGNKLSIDINTNLIDLEKFGQQKEQYYYNEDSYKGEPADTKVTVEVYEKHWEKEETGQYYDFINKVTRKKYRYYEVNNKINEFECNTAGGTYKYECPVENYSRYSSYYMIVKGTDTLNRPIEFTTYMCYSDIYPNYLETMDMVKNYTLKETNGKYRFGLGEDASLIMLENEKEFTMPKSARVLYMTLKNGLVDYTISSDNSYTVKFTESLIPNACLKAVYFDGSYVYNAGQFGLNYDYSERELDISVKPDKDQYKPGDTVNLEVSVADKSGNPCEAEVNLSVVDEAFFALREQTVDTISSIYSYVFGTGIKSDYYSYSPMTQRYPYAECGEGGDEFSIRSDFKDNAFFAVVNAGKDGKAEASFKLPDNMTSWRVTYQAVTDDLRAGNGKIDVDASLPFFTSLIFGDTFIEGDSPGISLRSYGAGVNGNDKVKYEVVIEGDDGYRKTFEKEQAASSFCNIGMESLKAGSYSMTVYAESGSYKDAVKKDFKVVKSVLETARKEYFALTDSLDIAPALEVSEDNSLTELVFYNKNISVYNRVLNSLYYTWGQRVDQVLARMVAGEYLKKYFNREYVSTAEDIELKDYQTDDGGIALLTYDSSDPQLSAKVCSLAPDSFDRTDLEAYFSRVAEDEKSANEDIAAAYWGLASLGSPVLLDIRSFLSESDISLTEKLYLGIALAELGDSSGAAKVYDSVLEEYGKSMTGYRYIDTGGDSDDIVEMTSLCGLLALKLNAEGAEELFNYAADKSTNDILINIEKLIYLTSTVPEAEKTGSFVMELDGNKKQIKLDGIERYSVVLTPEQLKNLRFENVEGDVEVAAIFTGPLSVLENGNSSLVRLTRTYSVNGTKTDTFSHSDVVEVTLKVEFDSAAPEGFYQITDVLPAGMKYISPGYWNWDDWDWGCANGQKIMFGYYYRPADKKSNSIKYLARVVAPGSYTADNAVVKHVKSQLCSFTERQDIKIGE